MDSDRLGGCPPTLFVVDPLSEIRASPAPEIELARAEQISMGIGKGTTRIPECITTMKCRKYLGSNVDKVTTNNQSEGVSFLFPITGTNLPFAFHSNCPE
ncbi:Os11g0631850 [Oryza sativa Japonica Group]|uniref:Os11g0631850 protein n=1 Tax=Oryza sativa subsp. japonica TaxID=39947 RepID=A0A0P0Y4N3_ORYSJ|nr:Os11g0631850 [Oryza sativa Japonica Group]